MTIICTFIFAAVHVYDKIIFYHNICYVSMINAVSSILKMKISFRIHRSVCRKPEESDPFLFLMWLEVKDIIAICTMAIDGDDIPVNMVVAR